jgi:hypothetical protein
MKMNQNQMSEEDVKKTRQATESIVEQCLKHVSTCRTMNLIHFTIVNTLSKQRELVRIM